VTLRIVNTLGEEIAVLADETLNAGTYSAEFNATNIPSGIYFYQLQSGTTLLSKRMTVMK
jgi:hypothetical protein